MTPCLVFLSAFLLFMIEPLISKWILPWYGGVASVWTTCLLFFQIALLLGYAWAYLLSKLRDPRAQISLHLVALSAALALLPVGPSPLLRPQGEEAPLGHLLYVLSISIGMPFFVLSATAPLLQSWRHRFSGEPSPYWLYAVSNAGSFLGLLAYPFLVEPSFDLALQAKLWSGGFSLFAVALALLSLRYLRSAKRDYLTTNEPSDSRSQSSRVPLRIVAQWLLLSACASWLLLASTNHLCRDVASIPLLWVIPLALFLLSYVLTFARRPIYSRKPVIVLFFISAGLVAFLHLQGGELFALVCAALVALFSGCMLCNGELVACKPSAQHLSLFYFVTALGGALGALFVSVIAPLIFSDYLEYPLGFQLCALLCLWRLFEADGLFTRPVSVRIAAWGVLVVLAIGGTYASLRLANDSLELVSLRSFFGVTRVRAVRDSQQRMRRELYHGSILHGLQFIDEPLRAAAYFGPASGVARAMHASDRGKGRQIAVIGLGIGTLAAYANPTDKVIFWEINPDIIDVARSHFTFLSQSKAELVVKYGDGRLGLERLPSDLRFDMIIMDAFNGDSIPVHLITKEALTLYLSHLADDGVLVFQISNLYLDLKPVLASLAREFTLAGRYVQSGANAALGTIDSEYVILSRHEQFFEHAELRQAAKPLVMREGFRMWRDSYASLWSIVK